MTGELWLQVSRIAPVVALLAFVLWIGFRGGWYFGPSVRRVIAQLEADRDAWRRLALELLREKGITLDNAALPSVIDRKTP